MDIEDIIIWPAVAEKLYQPMYNRIKEMGMIWVTVSPPYSANRPKDDVKRMISEDFKRLRHVCRELILVAEMSDQQRLHYHMVYDIRDKIGEYKVANRLRKDYMCRRYLGEPRGGIKYLFKSIHETAEYMEGERVIYDIVSIKPKKVVQEKDRIDTYRGIERYISPSLFPTRNEESSATQGAVGAA